MRRFLAFALAGFCCAALTACNLDFVEKHPPSDPNMTSENLAARIEFNYNGDPGQPFEYLDGVGRPHASRHWKSTDPQSGERELIAQLEKNGWKPYCWDGKPNLVFLHSGSDTDGGAAEAYVDTGAEEFFVSTDYGLTGGAVLCEDVGIVPATLALPSETG